MSKWKYKDRKRNSYTNKSESGTGLIYIQKLTVP